jgi:hypothetical protein
MLDDLDVGYADDEDVILVLKKNKKEKEEISLLEEAAEMANLPTDELEAIQAEKNADKKGVDSEEETSSKKKTSKKGKNSDEKIDDISMGSKDAEEIIQEELAKSSNKVNYDE